MNLFYFINSLSKSSRLNEEFKLPLLEFPLLLFPWLKISANFIFYDLSSTTPAPVNALIWRVVSSSSEVFIFSLVDKVLWFDELFFPLKS